VEGDDYFVFFGDVLSMGPVRWGFYDCRGEIINNHKLVANASESRTFPGRRDASRRGLLLAGITTELV
jgi:hypothetical protein